MQKTAQTGKLRPAVRLVAALLLLLLVGAGIAMADAAHSRRSERESYRDGIVLLAFYDGIQQSRQDTILSGAGAREIKRIGVGVHVVAVRRGGVPEVVQLLRAYGEVRFAEPDYLQTLSAGSLPNDASVGSQWAVQNTGQTVNGTAGTSGADERAPAAWSLTTGTNSVVIAELDTGVQYSHPDLSTNMWNNPGGIGGCSAGTHGFNVLTSSCDPMDDDTAYSGHGTHVAGIMGAVGNNAAGTAGVNWTTSIMAVKWVNSGGTGSTSDLITAMDKVVSAKQAGVNIRVVNDSQTWPGTAFSQALSDEIDLLGSNDILFVTASGNTAQNNDSVPRYPCSYNRPTMICVGASDQKDKLWSSANYGPNSVHLAAPGVNIYSTLRTSNFGYISGGSMASPQVAGAAALILSLGYQPVSSLKSMILNNVDTLSSLSGLVGTGGRLNVCKALPGCSSAVAGVPANSVPPVVTSIPLQGGLLGASTGVWTGLPLTYSYQWSRCDHNGLNCSSIPGATSQTYAPLAAADVLNTLAVTVAASNAFGSTAALSSASDPVATATSPSAISSTIVNGATISGSVTWKATPSRSEQFVQFYIDGVLTQTDSTSPYTFKTGALGSLDTTTLSNGPHVLGVRALYTDNRTYDFFGETAIISNPPQNTGLPVVSGTILSGQTISTSDGVWNGNSTPTSFAYQWEHCDSNGVNCAIISGATASSYTLSGADENFTIRSAVTGSNSGGSTTAVSAQTAIVPQSSFRITTTSLVSGTQNAAYTATLAATGGATPYTWTIASGTLPTGLALAPSSGVISGIPTAAGTSNFTVLVTDTNVLTATKALTLTVTGPLTVATTSLPAGAQLAPYSTALAATGGTPPYTWSVASGTLPFGMALASSTGVISGTSTVAGTSNFTVRVTDASSVTAAAPLSLTISAISNGGSGIGMVQANAVQGTSAGSLSSAFPIANTAGNLIVAFVRLSGTTQTVTMTDSAGNAYVEAVSQTQTADGSQAHLFYAPNIWGAANTVKATFSGSNGHPWLAVYEYTGLSTTNPLDQTAHAQGKSSTPSSGAMPTTTTANELVFVGIGLPSSYQGTQTADSGFTLLENDSATSAAATESMLVTATGSYTGTFTLGSSANWSAIVASFASGGISVTTTSLPGGTQNTTYSATLGSIGGIPPNTWSITSGTLPAGLTFAPSTGAISGTPTVIGTSNFTVQVSDANSVTATKPLSLTVVAPPAVTTTSLPDGSQNAAYSATLAATGGSIPYTWSIASGALPAGLGLASSTGVISGTPTVIGTSTFTVQVSDSNSIVASAQLSLTVLAPPLTVTTTSLPAGTVNAAYTVTLAANGGTAPYAWSIASGTLPAGLTFAPSTGAISGTPTVIGTSNFTVQVSDANSVTATKPLSLTVVAPPAVTTTSLPDGSQNAAYSATLAATGGSIPYTWSIASGALPAGLGLASSTGVISGTPTVMGTGTFTVQVSDSNSIVASAQLSLTVLAPPLTVTTTSLPAGTVNAAYTVTLAANGGTTPYAWSIATGTLPAGLALDSSTGKVSGTPTLAGTSNFTVLVTDANSVTATKALNLTVNGTIAQIQSNAVQGTNVVSVSAGFATTNTASDLIIAFVRMSGTTQTVSVTDSRGNTYVQAAAQTQTNDGSQVRLFYARNILGGANTVTATFSGTNGHPWLAIHEYSGLSTTSPLDRTASAQGSNSAPSSGATATTTIANELVFAGLGLPVSYQGTETAGGGFTLLLNDTGANNSQAANESRVVSVTGAYTGTFVLGSSANWSAVVATFKP